MSRIIGHRPEPLFRPNGERTGGCNRSANAARPARGYPRWQCGMADPPDKICFEALRVARSRRLYVLPPRGRVEARVTKGPQIRFCK